MTLAGLDLNGSFARAVVGPSGQARPVAIDGAETELPLAIGLENRQPELGRAALGLSRQAPHRLCQGFLTHLGDDRVWKSGRHRLDAAKAVNLVFERFAPHCKGTTAVGLAWPGYLEHAQAETLVRLAERARLPVNASLASSLALASQAHAEEPWEEVALVVEVDESALTWTVVERSDGQVRILGDLPMPRLGLRGWKECVLNAVADRCVTHSRRDPRESGPAEQMLFDQLERAFEKAARREMVELDIQTSTWFQNLHLRPEEIDAYAAPLAREAVEGMWSVLVAASCVGRPTAVLVAALAEPLPGLLASLPEHLGDRVAVRVSPVDAAAQAAHELAARVARGDGPRGLYDTSLPFPPALPVTDRAAPLKRILPLRESGT